MVDTACAVVLILFCIPVVYFDLRCRKIPNAVTYAGILIGLAAMIFLRQSQFMEYAAGLMVGFGLFYILHLFGWIGGGDVKLMAMIGVLMGWHFLAQSLVFIAIAGGVMAMGIAIYLLLQRKPLRGVTIPYGTAIVAGTYYTLWMRVAGMSIQ